MKINVENIRTVKVGRPLIAKLDNRRDCNSARNLVSYVNNTYPIKDHRYKVHVTTDNYIYISLIPTDDEENNV